MNELRRSAAGAWPSATQLLLLRAAAFDAAPASSAWCTWMASNDVADLDESSTRLLPAVDHNLRAHGVHNVLASKMAGLRRRALVRSQWLLRGAAETISLLGGSGIPCLVLKGAAVCCIDAPALSVRPMNDVDLLVPRQAAHEAIDTLMKAGFVARGRRPHDLVEARHSTPFTCGQIEIDLHWDVMFESRGLGTRWTFDRAVPFELAGRPALALDGTGRLFHAIAHGIRYSDTVACWWPLDALFILRGSDAIDFERLIGLAIEHDLTRVLYDGLAYLAWGLDVSIADEVLARLRAAPIGLMTQLEGFAREHRLDLLGELPMHLLQYRRLSAGRPLRERLSSLPAHLARVWQLDTSRDLPLAFARKALQRARTSIRPMRREI